jgi:hypothetical protein
MRTVYKLSPQRRRGAENAEFCVCKILRASAFKSFLVNHRMRYRHVQRYAQQNIKWEGNPQ